jgi:flagellar basal body P-ring formation protein FlgA
MQAAVHTLPGRMAQGCARLAMAALLAGSTGGPANAAPASQHEPESAQAEAEVSRLLHTLTKQAEGTTPRGRVEIEVGRLDPRLKLAPCQRVEPYLPAGQRAWGKVRVGLRCTQGAVAWNVYLPVTVRLWAPAVVVTTPVAADAVLQASDLGWAEVDVAERPAATFDEISPLVGRRVAVALAPGAALRTDLLKLRQWFEAGATVTVVAQGEGFRVTGEAQALSPGLEGQSVRLRTESGRLITAVPTGERRVELRL